MSREQILKAIKELAEANGGKPLGERTFASQSGIAKSDLFKAGFARYSEAVKAAGLQPNELKAAFDKDAMLEALAALTERLGRFPAIGDIKAARAKDSKLPSYEAFSRLSGASMRALQKMLAEFCGAKPELAEVASLLNVSSKSDLGEQASANSQARVRGYVYLARHGRDFKVGRSNDTARRRREISLLLPQELQHVHVIETDDPEGIERYWHQRFATRRQRGEWFRLTPEDVAAFKRRRYQ